MALERLRVNVANVLGTNYTVTSLRVSDYNPNIDSTVTLTVTVKDVYNRPVVGDEVAVTASEGNFTKLNGSGITAASTVTGTTDSNGEFTLTYSCSEWGLVTFSANNTSKQVKVDGWKRLTDNSNYEIQTDGKFVRVYFHHASNATLPKVYDYSLPNGYYPSYNVAAISSTIDNDGVHFADFIATTEGVLRIVLRKQTYNTSTQTIYGMLVYPI